MFTKDANMKIGQVFTKEFLEKECACKPNKQIAEENHCSMSTVRKYLKKYGLQCFNPTNKGKVAWNRKWEMKCTRYIKNRDNPEQIMERRSHNVMRKYIGRKIDKSHEVVHHLDRDYRNDVIENMVVMEKLDHDRLHMILRNKHLQSCTLDEVIDFLFKDKSTDELKRYAELTRIIPFTGKCKK